MSLSNTKNVELGPTGNKPSLVTHVGSSEPLTTIENVLSFCSTVSSALITNLEVVGLITSSGVPKISLFSKRKPKGSFPAWIE